MCDHALQFYRVVLRMSEVDRGATQEFSFVTMAHPQADHNEVGVRFERAAESAASAAVAAATAAAAMKDAARGALSGDTPEDVARRDTYLLFYVRDLATTLAGLRAYDERRAAAEADKQRFRVVRKHIHGAATPPGSPASDAKAVTVRSSIIVPPTRKHGLLAAVVRDPNGMRVRLVEFERNYVLVRCLWSRAACLPRLEEAC